MGASATKRFFQRLSTGLALYIYITLTLEVFLSLSQRLHPHTSTYTTHHITPTHPPTPHHTSHPHTHLHHTTHHTHPHTYTTPHSTAHHSHTPPERALGDRCIACVVPTGVGNRQYKDSLQRRKKMGECRQLGQVQHMHTTLY